MWCASRQSQSLNCRPTVRSPHKAPLEPPPGHRQQHDSVLLFDSCLAPSPMQLASSSIRLTVQSKWLECISPFTVHHVDVGLDHPMPAWMRLRRSGISKSRGINQLYSHVNSKHSVLWTAINLVCNCTSWTKSLRRVDNPAQLSGRLAPGTVTHHTTEESKPCPSAGYYWLLVSILAPNK